MKVKLPFHSGILKEDSWNVRKFGEGVDDGMTGSVEESVGCSVFWGSVGGGATELDSERHPGIRPHQQERALRSDTMTSGTRGGWIWEGNTDGTQIVTRGASCVNAIRGASCVNAVMGRSKITRLPTQVTHLLLHPAFKH